MIDAPNQRLTVSNRLHFEGDGYDGRNHSRSPAMKPAIHVPHAVLTDPRTVPAVLAGVIADMTADVDHRIAAVATLDAQLGIEYAKWRLGMMCPSLGLQSIRDQLDAEIAGLATARRTLDGLRAIEAARAALPEPTAAKPAVKHVFDKASGRLVTVDG
jgi:hypothetical protein